MNLGDVINRIMSLLEIPRVREHLVNKCFSSDLFHELISIVYEKITGREPCIEEVVEITRILLEEGFIIEYTVNDIKCYVLNTNNSIVEHRVVYEK